MTDTLDTSGLVEGAPYVDMGDGQQFLAVGWAMLTPFEQGYVEAMLKQWFSFSCGGCRVYNGHPHEHRPIAFRDIAPATLAAIRKDCSDYAWFVSGPNALPALPATDGAALWASRSEGFRYIAGSTIGDDLLKRFPALVVSLTDGGDVVFL